MNWVSAKTACRGLGTGWRLPTNKELGDMYDNRVDIGGFSLSYYWSSTECNPNGSNETAYGQKFFGDGTLVQGQKSNASNVRAVRSF